MSHLQDYLLIEIANYESTCNRHVWFKGGQEPYQRHSRISLLRSADSVCAQLLKHKELSDFHSKEEFMYSIILESEPSVISIVPQPFELKIEGLKYHYKPDVFFLCRDGRRYVVEIKPQGKFDKVISNALVPFFRKTGIEFVEVTNENIRKKKQLVDNWRFILTHLVRHRNENVDPHFEDIEFGVRTGDIRTFGDCISTGDRANTFAQEIALYRLLHKGKLKSPLETVPLSLEMPIQLCA